jgi:uncharacterized protein DUF5615
VECFATHFRDAKGRKEESVKDPRIIKFCDEKKWVLVTTDRNMSLTHIETIKKTEIAIIATSSNNQPLDTWAKALIKAKPKIERFVRKHPRPSFATIGTTGCLTQRAISAKAHTRRHRPFEGQEPTGDSPSKKL